MKRILVASIVLAASFSASAGTAFFSHEETTGLTKQCYYDYLGSTYTKTMKSIDLCPLTIEV